MHKKSLNSNQKSAMQEISQQLMSLFAENTFWMELHTFQIPLAMANPHNLAGFARAVTSKHAGNELGSTTSEW